MAKFLIFFADGTWNGVMGKGNDDNGQGGLPATSSNALSA